MNTYTDKLPSCCMSCVHSIPRANTKPQEFDCNLKKALITWSEYASPKDCPLKLLPKMSDNLTIINSLKEYAEKNCNNGEIEFSKNIITVVGGMLERDLRHYAEQKYQNGEIELANGILKAACRISDICSFDETDSSEENNA